MYRPPVTWLLAQSRRSFFDDFARERRFDPLIAENWYTVKQAEIRAREVHPSPPLLSFLLSFTFQGGSGVLRYYDGSYIRALMVLYPKIGLKPSGFLRTPGVFFISPYYLK